MARTITGFTITTSLPITNSSSDLNPGNGNETGDNTGITLRGTYTTTGSGSSITNDDRITVTVKEGNSTHTLSGTFTFNSNGTFSFVTTDGDLSTLVNGDNVQFIFTDNKGTSWTTSDDTILTTSPLIKILCFYPGTMIATPDGEVAVEDLAIGDMVLRQDGSTVPVRWMGRNTVSLLFADKMKALPIRIKKDALAANVPSRDLLVSPQHAMFVDGILAQASALVNGTSIVRETNVPSTFVYHHIELAEHALIMAENAPTESFIDNVDREAYDNWAEHEALYGDLPALVEMELPRAKSQRQVPSATRQRLAARAVELGYSAVTSAVA
jgi:hypothetical protein